MGFCFILFSTRLWHSYKFAVATPVPRRQTTTIDANPYFVTEYMTRLFAYWLKAKTRCRAADKASGDGVGGR